jgi:hypothetical protein
MTRPSSRIGPALAVACACALAACNKTCTLSSAAPSTQTYTVGGPAQSIGFPTYNVWTATADIPQTEIYRAPEDHGVLTISDSQNAFPSPAPTFVPGYNERAKDFFATLSVDKLTAFAPPPATNPLVPITFKSNCLVAGTTYHLDQFAFGARVYSETAVATGGVLGFNVLSTHFSIHVNPQPADAVYELVVSH